ncbi:unnamed protein product, partial [Didymodactylos carnosus]
KEAEEMTTNLTNQILLKGIQPAEQFTGRDDQDPIAWVQGSNELFVATDLLLGGDFCDKYNVNISYGGKYLTISTRQQQTRVKFQQQPNTQQVFHLNTLNGIAIPPLSSKVIQAASSSSPMSAIFTPSSRMTNKQHVIAPHAILTIDNTNTTTLTLLNTTTSFKRIPQGTTLGQIKNLEDNTCCY